MPLSPSNPTHVAPLLAHATQLLKAGRAADAVVPLREAARYLPRHAGILHDLGLACLECGRLSEAVTALRASIAADPGLVDSYVRLGIALEATDDTDGALESYRQALKRSATLADASYRAGCLLDSLGHAARASEMFRHAAASAPGTSFGRIAMARALLAENRDGEAESLLRRVIAADGDNATALELLGNTLAEAGRFEEARRCFERAIEKAPALAGSYYELVRCGRMGPEDAGLIERIRSVLDSPRLDAAQRVRVHLALGKVADDLGEYQEAMRQLDAAETVRNTIVRFDLARFEARVDRLIASFTADRIAHASTTSLDDATAILIVGLPRSGTTLLEQILSAHPQVGAAGELPFWNERGSAWERAGPALEGESLRATAADYVALLRRSAPGAARVTDKNPLSFQWAGLISMALPRATIIHCRRSPIDTALSIHQTHFNPRMSFPTGGAALVGYIRAYQRLCAHWRLVLPAERFIEIDYEALVSQPEPQIRRLLAACGLQWSSSCLFPERNARAIKTPSKWQARQPIHSGSVGRWRNYAPWLGPLGALRD